MCVNYNNISGQNTLDLWNKNEGYQLQSNAPLMQNHTQCLAY